MRLYFMSICGTGMGNGALLMREMGHEVMGADQNTYPPMSDKLREAGISILEGYDPRRLAELKPDLVVVGNVNTRGNPEVEWLLAERRLPFVSLPELLSRELFQQRKTIVITGTHGKTTTTALTAHLLRGNGVDAGYFIGGVPLGFESGAALGAADAPFVIEGDEYDSAFFDKRSKFIHYCPRTLLINNLEFDHADIFRDLEDVQRTFHHLIKLVPSSGSIIANGDTASLEPLLKVDYAPVFRVGVGDRSDLRIINFEEDPQGSRFELVYRETNWGRIEWKLPGLYNARNAAMAALGAARAVGLSEATELNLNCLADFKGVRRRQEILAETASQIVMTDFAHHPTAVREVLMSLKKRYEGHLLVVAFEARSNTACRNIHESEFELALDLADLVFLGEVYRAERYSQQDRIDFAGIAERLGEKARAFRSNEELGAACESLRRHQSRCVLVFLSNGSFDGIPAKVAAMEID
jgi:UDP-N-acetylmuramate: L-alanyl-gamma-D-glutamyl-meso-diaminopimelate ligase